MAHSAQVPPARQVGVKGGDLQVVQVPPSGPQAAAEFPCSQVPEVVSQHPSLHWPAAVQADVQWPALQLL